MKLSVRYIIAIGAISLLAPAFALASNGNGKSEDAPGHDGSPPPKAKAYGKYCKGESKKHKEGEKGTAFSRCVKTAAQAARHENRKPGQVCKGKSKKHVKGEKGTEFSRCVKSVVQLRRDERREEREQKEQEQQESQEESQS
jgi:hypothetical protein